MHIQVDRVFTTVARNLGLKDFSRYTNNWIEWSYEAEKLIGSRDTFVQKEVTYDASGAQATGTITFSANPSSGDSITLNGVKLYFRNTTDLGEAKSPNEIEIGNSLAETLDNTTAQYGLYQSLTGLIDVSAGTGTYTNSAIFSYPEALNVADYSISSETLGSELVVDPGFDDPSLWTEDLGTSDWTVSGSAATIDGTQVASRILRTTGSAGLGDLISGDAYNITVVVSSYTAGVLKAKLGGGTSVDFNITAAGTYTVRTSNSGQDNVQAQADDSFNGTITSFSVKKILTKDLTITAKEIGNKGNEYTLSSDNANAKVSGLNLTGGKGIYRNQQITLPENNIKILAVRVGTDDSNHEHAELRRTSAVHRGRVGKTTDDSQQRAFRYYVDGNRLNIQHDDLDEITVVYLAYPVDLRGWPKIKEGHETAVAQYIMWQMKLIDFYNGNLPQYITKELEKRWYYLCGKARGDDSMPTSEELRQIGNIWNTLVPVKSNNGLIDL